MPLADSRMNALPCGTNGAREFMKKHEYEQLDAAAREKHDRQNLIGFLIRCRIKYCDVIDAMWNRMDFLDGAAREEVLNFVKPYLP